MATEYVISSLQKYEELKGERFEELLNYIAEATLWPICLKSAKIVACRVNGKNFERSNYLCKQKYIRIHQIVVVH